MSKTDRQLLGQKVCQRISVMKTNNGIFVVFKAKHKIKMPIFWRNIWRSVLDIAEILPYSNIYIFSALVDVSWQTCAQNEMPKKCGQKILIVDLREFTSWTIVEFM